MEGESTTDRLNLSWSRRWTYYRSIQSLLVNDQSHKIQLKALSRLILRLVNQETGGFGPLISSHWSSRSWIPSTQRIHKPRDTTAYKVKLEALSQFDIEACVSERTYYRSVQIHCFWGWIYYKTIQSNNLERWTYYRSVQPPELEDKLIDGLV
jgi:hypothetical protein